MSLSTILEIGMNKSSKSCMFSASKKKEGTQTRWMQTMQYVLSSRFPFFLICEFLSRFKDHTVHSWGASKLQVHRIRKKKSGFFKAQGSEISEGKQPEYHTFLPWNSHMKNSLLYLSLQNSCWRFGHCFLHRMASKEDILDRDRWPRHSLSIYSQWHETQTTLGRLDDNVVLHFSFVFNLLLLVNKYLFEFANMLLKFKCCLNLC